MFFKKVLILNPYPQTPFPRERLYMLGWLCVLAKPFGIYTPGIHAGAERGATAPSPSKDACSQPHKATMQGRIMTATQSRYARMHKDSHTKPLHDATAQMAVNAQMQRHKQLTLQRCKTSRASNMRHPHF